MTRAKRKDIAFKGWDWTELLAVWRRSSKRGWPKDTHESPFASEEAQGKWLNEKIAELFSSQQRTPLDEWRYRQVLRYLRKCASVCPHTCKRIMVAIANEPDDYARLQFIGDIRGWWS